MKRKLIELLNRFIGLEKRRLQHYSCLYLLFNIYLFIYLLFNTHLYFYNTYFYVNSYLATNKIKKKLKTKSDLPPFPLLFNLRKQNVLRIVTLLWHNGLPIHWQPYCEITFLLNYRTTNQVINQNHNLRMIDGSLFPREYWVSRSRSSKNDGKLWKGGQISRGFKPSNGLIDVFQLLIGWVQHFVNNLSSRRQSMSHGALDHRCIGFGQNVSLASAVDGCWVKTVRVKLLKILSIVQVTFRTASFFEETVHRYGAYGVFVRQHFGHLIPLGNCLSIAGCSAIENKKTHKVCVRLRRCQKKMKGDKTMDNAKNVWNHGIGNAYGTHLRIFNLHFLFFTKRGWSSIVLNTYTR